MLERGRVTILQYVHLDSTFFSHYRNSVNYYRLLKQTANFQLLCSKNVKISNEKMALFSLKKILLCMKSEIVETAKMKSLDFLHWCLMLLFFLSVCSE